MGKRMEEEGGKFIYKSRVRRAGKSMKWRKKSKLWRNGGGERQGRKVKSGEGKRMERT